MMNNLRWIVTDKLLMLAVLVAPNTQAKPLLLHCCHVYFKRSVELLKQGKEG